MLKPAVCISLQNCNYFIDCNHNPFLTLTVFYFPKQNPSLLATTNIFHEEEQARVSIKLILEFFWVFFMFY